MVVSVGHTLGLLWGLLSLGVVGVYKQEAETWSAGKEVVRANCACLSFPATRLLPLLGSTEGVNWSAFCPGHPLLSVPCGPDH